MSVERIEEDFVFSGTLDGVTIDGTLLTVLDGCIVIGTTDCATGVLVAGVAAGSAVNGASKLFIPLAIGLNRFAMASYCLCRYFNQVS